MKPTDPLTTLSRPIYKAGRILMNWTDKPTWPPPNDWPQPHFAALAETKRGWSPTEDWETMSIVTSHPCSFSFILYAAVNK